MRKDIRGAVVAIVVMTLALGLVYPLVVTGVGQEGALRCYDPARGAVVTVTREAFRSGRLGLSRWDRPWFTIPPQGRRTQA